MNSLEGRVKKIMDCSSGFIKGTYTKMNRAWLLTWEWAGSHAQVKERFVAVISSRYQDSSVREILEQYYVSSYLSLREQFAYIKSRKHCPYTVQYNTMAVSEKLQKISSLPPQMPFSESLIIGGNPWLWARIVSGLETWMDENNVEHLKWRERENIRLDDGGMISDWREGSLER